MVSTTEDPQAALGELETVRELLNTWLIPNDTRVAVDRFDDYARRRRLSPKGAATLRRLRDDLRTALEDGTALDGVVNRWIERSGLGVVMTDGHVGFRHDSSPAATALAAVLDSVVARRWDRLKACPDCRWVFYDHTRNGAKRWCLMTPAGSNGRGCGNIAKVRRYRDRQRKPETRGQ
jgi:hypothetical protein